MSTRILFEHPICTVEGFPVGPHEFMRLKMADWVNVVPVTADNRVVLIRQHRWGIDAPTLEIPGGIVDPGEDPETGGLRELREETGWGAPTSVLPLGMLQPNPAIQNNRLHMYLARGVTLVGEPEPDETEDIAVELVDWAAIPGLLADGSIRHALVVAALQAALLLE